MNPWLISASAVAAALPGVAAYGAAYPRAQLFGPTICRTHSASELAITFDDGPNPAITPKLLDLLDRHRARASFFLIGRFVRECPALVREVAARGHTIGNHTYTHPNLLLLGPAQIRNELRRCHDAIADVLSAPPKFFRPPFGLRNPWLAGAARDLGVPVVMWTLLPGDWRATSDDWLISRMKPISARPQRKLRTLSGHSAPTGEVLCLHDGSHRRQNGDRTHTLAALEFWLPRWRDLGLQFVTIDGAVRAPAS